MTEHDMVRSGGRVREEGAIAGVGNIHDASSSLEGNWVPSYCEHDRYRFWWFKGHQGRTTRTYCLFIRMDCRTGRGTAQQTNTLT